MIFKKVYRKLERKASKFGITVLFLLSHTVLALMLLFSFPRINTKLGTKAFDLKPFGYSESEATLMLGNLDQPTIDFYLFPQIFFLDILYPILVTLFLSTLIIRFSNLIKISENHVFSNLYILPFIAMFFDYFENITIALMITNPENISSFMIKSASIFTQTKAGFTALSWLVILILLVSWRVYKNKKITNTTSR